MGGSFPLFFRKDPAWLLLSYLVDGNLYRAPEYGDSGSWFGKYWEQLEGLSGMSPRRYRYQQLADEIENQIKTDVFKAGDRLPSTRHLHHRTGYSINTVFRAFIELEKRGLVEVRPRSGCYVAPVLGQILPLSRRKKGHPKPKKVTLSNMVSAVVEAMADRRLLRLGGTLVSPDLLPLKPITGHIKSIPNGKMADFLSTYEDPSGREDLRRRIAEHSLTLFQNVRADDVIITNGCIEAVNLCLQAVAGAGDTVMVESPTYPQFLQIIENNHMLALELPTDPEKGIDLSSVQRAVDRHPVKACILNPNFHNPMGFEMPEEKKKALVDLLSRKGVAIIEDDIHGDLYFGVRRPGTLKYHDREGMILYCSSFSKTVAPGIRVGWALPGRFTSKVRQLKLNHTIASTPLVQYATAKYLKSGAYERHLRRLRAALQQQVRSMSAAVARYFPPGTRISVPKGGLVLWVEMNPCIDSLAVYREAQRQGIAILPGAVCGTTRQYNHFIRLNCGFPWDEDLEKGIETLGRIVCRFEQLK